jgi:hypothetical protein
MDSDGRASASPAEGVVAGGSRVLLFICSFACLSAVVSSQGIGARKTDTNDCPCHSRESEHGQRKRYTSFPRRPRPSSPLTRLMVTSRRCLGRPNLARNCRRTLTLKPWGNGYLPSTATPGLRRRSSHRHSFLAVGFLGWCEKDKSEVVREAPLALIGAPRIVATIQPRLLKVPKSRKNQCKQLRQSPEIIESTNAVMAGLVPGARPGHPRR